jgi:hypothetical protein
MNVREKLESLLVREGMFNQQAIEVINISIKKIDELSGSSPIDWESDSNSFGVDEYDFLMRIIKPYALEWIENNVPKAWFKENFIN